MEGEEEVEEDKRRQRIHIPPYKPPSKKMGRV